MRRPGRKHLPECFKTLLRRQVDAFACFCAREVGPRAGQMVLIRVGVVVDVNGRVTVAMVERRRTDRDPMGKMGFK